MAHSDFLPFATASDANILNQAGYAALAELSSGFASGVASSQVVNTLLKKALDAAAGLGQYLVNEGQNATDDGLPATLAGQIKAAIAAQIVAYAYATLNSPALTGTPTAPTAANGTNSTQIATTAFVQAVQAYIQSWVNSGFASQADLHGNYSTTAAMENWVLQYFLQTSTAAAIYQPLLGYTPVRQANTNNTLYMAWAANHLRLQVDATDEGPVALWSDFSFGNASNGWQNFANGGLMQWGVVNCTSPGQVFNFPKSFPNGVVMMVGCDQGNPSTGTSTVNTVTVQPILGNTSQFKAFGYLNGSVATTNICYVCFGF